MIDPKTGEPYVVYTKEELVLAAVDTLVRALQRFEYDADGSKINDVTSLGVSTASLILDKLGAWHLIGSPNLKDDLMLPRI